MSDHSSDSWDAYWRGANRGAVCGGEGATHRLFVSFWDNFFETIRKERPAPRIIDIASGTGAVVERAKAAFGAQLPDFTCLDASASAIDRLLQRFPTAHGIVADARAIPLKSAGYEVATSQFGVEYAGLEAVDEMARLVSPTGRLALLLHHRGGGIHRQCAASLDAIERMQKAEFIPLSTAMLQEGFAAFLSGERDKYDGAAKQLVPAIREMESIMKDHGKHVADGTILGLYSDVRKVVGRLRHYEPSEVLGWLQALEQEMPAYAGRMASMCRVALDGEDFEKLCGRLQGQGYGISRGEPLAGPAHSESLAWALIAVKQ